MRKVTPWKTSLVACGAALVISGCSTLEPELPEAAPRVPADWPIPATGVASGASDDDFTVADIGWRDFFADPNLVGLIDLSLANNRDLRVAVLNVERARALYRVERADRYPWVDGRASMTRTDGDRLAAPELYRVELGVAEFELDLFGRVRNLSDAALRRYFATEEARRSAQLALVAEVANAYLTLAADQELQRIARAMLENFEEEYEVTRERYRLGAVSSLDVSQSRTIVERARADVARFAGQVAQDRNALALLVGAPIDQALMPEEFDARLAGIEELPVGLPSDVLLRRPDVLQAEFQLLAANADIGAARAAFFPSITLTGAVGVVSEELSGLFDDGAGTWAFVPRLNLPIFQGGRLRANRDVAIADRDIALARYEEAIQIGFQEAADALALTETLQAQRSAQEDLLEAARKAHELSQIRYEAGQDSYLILLDAQRTLYSAQQDLVTTQLTELANRVNLYKVLGGGWREETE